MSALRGVALLSLFLSLAACTARTADDDGDGGARGNAAGGMPGTRPPLPLDPYSDQHDGLFHKTRLADDRLVRACMKQRGVPWNPPPVSRADADPPSRRYGVTEGADAQKSGYHPPVDPARERRNRYFLHELTARQKAALDGDKRHPGCRARATAAIHRGVPKKQTFLVFQLEAEALKKSARTPGVRAAKKAWSDCMRERGHHYPTPEAAALNKKWDLDSPRISGRERAVALADAACKQKTSLVRTWSRAEADVQRQLIRRYATELAAARQANETRRANVDRILTDDHGQP
ncbi:hypothetical protein GCM10010252_00380 [Streptomyces aureoverticillatus]|nr:hypothetical protein GCM10010252_00380 [Streptomyces aureoverticillatus]